MNATLLLDRDERDQAAKLFGFLALGETLARDCARAQADIAPDRRARRFLIAQARQETFHKAVFDRAVKWLARPGVDVSPDLAPMQAYRRRLEAALARGNFAESLLAQQVILEGLGDVVCGRIARGIDNRGLGFSQVRRLILHQEHAHQLFGIRRLAPLLGADPELEERLASSARAYFELVEQMLHNLDGLFRFFDEDAGVYVDEVRASLPPWLSRRL